jgi:O-succinylbenzoate synthase
MSFIIKSAKVIVIRLPLKFPFRTGFGEVTFRESVLVKLTTQNGVVGYGEAAGLPLPVYLEEFTGSIVAALHDVLLPLVVGETMDPEIFYAKIASLRGNRLARYAVVCALCMIRSLEEKRPLSELIGGHRQQIAIGESIGMLPTIEQTLELIEQRVAEGYKRIKVKIKPGWDVELVRAIRHKFPELPLMVDANSSYTLADADKLKELDQFHLMMIEQPLEFDDLWHHSLLQKQLTTPICLDESITSFEKAQKAIAMGACRIINVKPGRIGSIVETMQINQLAKEAQIPLWCGGMLEAGIANAFNIAVASLSEFSLPADIFISAKIFAEDIVEPPITMQNGLISVPQTSGLGFAVKENTIQKLTQH